MDDASAQFYILSKHMIYRNQAGLVDKDSTNDHSSTLPLRNLILHLEILLSLLPANSTLNLWI